MLKPLFQSVPRRMGVGGDRLATRRAGPALEIDSLHKRFGSVDAVRGLGLTLARGECLALLGPNGAGKTTLIRCIAGRTRPDSGAIRLLDRKLPATGGRNRLGWVPQEIALYGDLTTRENLIAFGRFHLLRGKTLHRRVDWALDWTGLADRSREPVATFSGGMKRRVNLACGVMHAPEVLLLDEPTVGVDPQSRRRIFEMLGELQNEGTAVLLTTHQLDDARRQCDRVVIVDHGRVIADGTADELIARTVGSLRLVRVRLDRPIADPPQPWKPGGDAAVGQSGSLSAAVNDVAAELPQLLESLRRQGHGVNTVDVHSPTLDDVFLHLTGRGLRD